MDGLFEQMANISKAHGYDILAEQVGELKKENATLREALTRTLNEYKAACKLLAEATNTIWSENNVSINVEEAMRVTKFS